MSPWLLARARWARGPVGIYIGRARVAGAYVPDSVPPARVYALLGGPCV